MKLNLSLKRQFFILISIQLLFGLIIQSYYSFNLNRLLVDRQKEYVQNSEDQIVSIINNKQKSINYIGETLVLNTLHQEFINENDPIKKAGLIKHIKRNFSEISERNHDVTDIKILSSDGDILVENIMGTRFVMAEMLQEYSLESIRSGLVTTFYYDDYYSINKKNRMHFFYISPIYSTTEYTGKALGYIIIAVSMSHINNYLNKGSDYIISDKNGVIGASTNHTLINTNELNINGNEKAKQRVIDVLDWTIYSNNSFTNIKTNITPVINNGIIILVAALVFMALSSIIIMNSITNPIKDIILSLRDIASKKHNKIKSTNSNEIEILTKEINIMLHKIEESNTELIEKNGFLLLEKVEKKRAQLEALQSQINPHFLYNTLESIRMMSLTDDRKEIATAIKILANLFRYTTKTDVKEVSFKEELNHVKNYTELLKIRYEDNVVINYEIDETLYKNRTLKFILQPIVENAFEHGLKNKIGTIIIRLKKIKNSAVFSVIDNGSGIDDNTLDLMSKRLNNEIKQTNGSIGLYNVNKRIKLKYGDKYGVFIKSNIDIGTTVSIFLPNEENV
ncbi:MAG: histidine kinase [Spirochaetaceae bacterium]